MAKKLETKDFSFEVKEISDEGAFSGYLSVFDVEDTYGDTVVKGAFKRTLKNKKEFPFLWSHSVDDPIGVFTGKEDQTGLLISGRLVLGVQRAKEVRELMKAGAVKGLSIGYQTIKEEVDNKNGKRKLLEVNLWEGSACVFQSNPESVLTDVKADDLEDEDEPVMLCEHCADELDEEPGQPTPPEPPPLDKSNPEHLHLLEEYREHLLALKNLMEVKS